jgi:hypothetical protein
MKKLVVKVLVALLLTTTCSTIQGYSIQNDAVLQMLIEERKGKKDATAATTSATNITSAGTTSATNNGGPISIVADMNSSGAISGINFGSGHDSSNVMPISNVGTFFLLSTGLERYIESTAERRNC